MNWPEAIVWIFTAIAIVIFWQGWPNIFIHTKCNCKKE